MVLQSGNATVVFETDEKFVIGCDEEVSKDNQEDIFYKNINYDVIFGKNRKC